jgi:hypothetical protein
LTPLLTFCHRPVERLRVAPRHLRLPAHKDRSYARPLVLPKAHLVPVSLLVLLDLRLRRHLCSCSGRRLDFLASLAMTRLFLAIFGFKMNLSACSPAWILGGGRVHSRRKRPIEMIIILSPYGFPKKVPLYSGARDQSAGGRHGGKTQRVPTATSSIYELAHIHLGVYCVMRRICNCCSHH